MKNKDYMIFLTAGKILRNILKITLIAVIFTSCYSSKVHLPGGKRKKKNCDCPSWTFQPIKENERTDERKA